MVAMDRAGNAVVGYEERGSVLIRRSSPNRPFGPAVQAAPDTGLIYLGMDDRGELLLVTTSEDGNIQARVAPRGRRLGPRQRITRAGGGISCCTAPIVAIGPRGDALIAWVDGGAGAEHRVQALYRRAGQPFGRTQTLAEFADGEEDPATPQQAVVDQRGRAVLAMVGSGSWTTPATLKVSTSKASGRLSVPVVLGSNLSNAPEVISLAANRTGETALRYVETSPPAQPYPVFPFTVDVRISASGKPFGPALALCSGLLGPTPAPPIECEASRKLVGASGGGFYAVSAFTRKPPSADGYDVVQIERITRSSAGPTVQVALPSYSEQAQREAEPEPASVVDLGALAYADAHGRLEGNVTCGNAYGASCSIETTITTTSRPRLVIAHARVSATAGESSIVVKLRSAITQRLRHRRAISALVHTVTEGRGGAGLRTDYPLTIIFPGRP
jgi:hypothetical protein